MGNSNSIPNLSPPKQRLTLEELNSYYHQEGINFNSENRRSLRNNNNNNDNQQFQSRLTDAYLHETYNDQNQQLSLPQIAHVKVLPDFNPDGARLRCTTNGNILNSGGTISGRKEHPNQLQLDKQQESFKSYSPLPSSPSNILRNRSSESPAQIYRNRSSEPPMGQIYRNKSTEHLKDINRRSYKLSAKLSDPINKNNKNQQHENLLGQRNDDNEINRNINQKLNIFPLSTKTNIIKCKKKKSAPLPPPIRTPEINNSTNNRNYPLINSYDKQKPIPNQTIQLGQQKKLRLFKTNAETKKSLPSTSSLQYQNNNNNNNINSRGIQDDHTCLTGQTINDKKNLKTGNNYKDTRLKLFPTPIIFRREKSFDASLLSNHRKQYNNNNEIDLKQNVNHKIQQPHNLNDNSIYKNQLQNDHERMPNVKKSNLEMKINKISQPSMFQNNFKRELEEATKNRRNSISAIDLTSLNSINYDNKELKTQINKNHNEIDQDLRRKITSNQILCQNDERNIISRKSNNTNISNGELKSKKFYFGMRATTKIDKINDEPAVDLHDKLSSCSSSGKNRIVNQNLSGIIDEFSKKIINHKDINNLTSESDDLSTTDILNYNSSPQPYKIPKNCTNNTNIDDDTGDIQLNVRPTLPRRQLEIPRFSPAAAWRMLNDEQKILLANLSNNRKLNGLNSSSETLSIKSLDLIKQQPPVLEERIQRIFREPPLIYSDNKSGDSGISGDDAGLQLDGGTDSPGINFIQDNQDNKNNGHELLRPTTSSGAIGNFLIPWTPQQDLEDDDDDDDDDDEISSSDGNNIKLLTDDTDGIRGHVFSVSLPREGHHQNQSFADKEKFGFSSLQKLKRTVSGAFLAGGNCTGNSSTAQIITSDNLNSLQNDIPQTSTRTSNYCNDNWLLSSSALNSIENAPILSANNRDNSNQHRKSKSLKQYDENSKSVNKGNELSNDVGNLKGKSPTNGKLQPSSLNYVTTGRHMMYLPNRTKENNNNYNNEKQFPGNNGSSKNKNTKKQLNNLPIKANNKKDNSKKEVFRENLQDLVPKEKKSAAVNRQKNSSNHRFTFQSTVRQIERRRLAERLSKEAEEKEALRKSELEAMTRVEEEFQRKRAREKATICQQLRLYSMEENQCNSLPVDLPVYNNNDNTNDINNDLLLQKMPIISRNNKINNFNNNSNRNYRAEPDGAVSNSTPPSPTYSQKNHKMNNGNYYDDDYFDDSKGNQNERQRKSSNNLNYFQKTEYMDTVNRNPIQVYNENNKFINSSTFVAHRINIHDEYNSDSEISGKNNIRTKYKRHSYKYFQ